MAHLINMASRSNDQVAGCMKHVCAILLLLWIVGAPGAAGREVLEPGGEGRVASVVDGDTVVLADGRQVRLVGIQAPKLPLGRPEFRAWPLAEEAKQFLVALVLGERVRLFYGGQPVDRYGRQLAHLYLDDGRWVQGEILRQGMARVYSFPDNRALVAEMLALEREARRNRRGIWDHPYYAIRDHAETRRHIDSFQLVEGRVMRVGRGRRNLYLNFGANWRRDFTIAIGPRARRLFDDAGMDPVALEGRSVRVRGWLKWRNGPMIEVSHPEQIEPLSD